MKKHYFLLIASAICLFSSVDKAVAQCPGGYTQAQLNWDNLDYYWNSGLNIAPYGYRVGSTNFTFVSDPMEQTQRFAIGTTYATIATSNAAVVNPGATLSAENATHTGEIANYTGEDVQFNPNADGQSITITFATPVSDPNFTLYDIDGTATYTVTATNNLNAATAVNVATYAGTILIVGVLPLNRTISTLSGADLANNLNTGTATVTVPGLVNSITITITARGSNPVFWLSDINACVNGTFPTNWHQGFSNRPFVGPTQNQPDYFIVTPDNKSAYMMDPVTGRCWFLFSETAAAPYINSFGYDPVNKYLYYVTDGSGTPRNNKTLKRYNFNTETIQTVTADITTAFNMPTFDQGVESGAGAFYNNILYLGVEGGRYGSAGSTITRESIIWAINFDASQNPLTANQVMAIPAYRNSTDSTAHDWADFIIRDGNVYNFNTARAGSSPVRYKYSAYHHFNMMTGNMDAYYQNPNQNVTYTGQSGLTWSGQLYFVRDSVGLYNEDGTNSSTRYRAVVQNVPGDPAPPAWVGGAGDASDPFRPKCDFGDAPDSYDPYADPSTQSPAVHERSELIRLGATWNREFWKRGTAGTDDTDDGLAYTPIMAPGGGGYVVQVAAFNNSGANATMIAWLDYNGNGVFDAAEAITPITVPTSASSQNFWLYWPVTTNTFSNGDFTYLRIRITAASAGMTTSHPTGYFTNGEVEDYRILVDNFPLANHLLNFEASLQDKKVKLNWEVTEDAGLYAYEIERSRDNINWTKITTVNANGTTGTFSYESFDNNPPKGVSYYRLRLIESTGMNRFSPVKRIIIKDLESGLIVAPNPAKDNLTIRFDAAGGGDIEISILNMQGSMLLSRKQRITAGLNNIMISLPETISAGTYVARIVVGGEVVYKKLIVNK
ncbi:MAG: T9SS type A sorting domain-containing protein [Chitinophagaceae bacterium]|nr:T9SS type A sorting domain-containing protein [Chitinophagaceae bacterium]